MQNIPCHFKATSKHLWRRRYSVTTYPHISRIQLFQGHSFEVAGYSTVVLS